MALQNFEKVLDIQLKLWHRNDAKYGPAYSDIGKIYLHKNDYSAALTAYQKQIEVKLESLSSKHPSFGTMYADMSLVYMASHYYIKTFEYLQRAINMDPHVTMNFGSISENN
ncbi:unnamed protein product [Rotaria sp. Silwood2]|nr:unnamed protein product [Rotaria sp. Silwood2]CAF2750426.1 unnamed protein product [Rotaria sp. Silwood2]CAF3018190.1 unnamed protein product [Rotaria sp. Silwood2]CAF3183670.1 unnamed protein product [Rotaria sp. Silwood2]CAF3887904.1 unnamed protein product [Rotaria sp. Silwood2]